LPKIISVYNETPHDHAYLNNRTPDEVYADNDEKEKRFRQDIKHNLAEDAKKAPTSVGDTVRILEKKEIFAKEGPTFSKELYVVVKKDGLKWRVHPKTGGPLERRKFADNDLLVINADTLVALPDQTVQQDIDKGVERHRTRLQREGIIDDKSDLDRAVALPVQHKIPRKSKEVALQIQHKIPRKSKKVALPIQHKIPRNSKKVALPIQHKIPRNSKEVPKEPNKLILSRGTDQARQKILKTYKRLSDMEEND
jgi:hypothetical protein